MSKRDDIIVKFQELASLDEHDVKFTCLPQDVVNQIVAILEPDGGWRRIAAHLGYGFHDINYIAFQHDCCRTLFNRYAIGKNSLNLFKDALLEHKFEDVLKILNDHWQDIKKDRVYITGKYPELAYLDEHDVKFTCLPEDALNKIAKILGPADLHGWRLVASDLGYSYHDINYISSLTEYRGCSCRNLFDRYANDQNNLKLFRDALVKHQLEGVLEILTDHWQDIMNTHRKPPIRNYPVQSLMDPNIPSATTTTCRSQLERWNSCPSYDNRPQDPHHCEARHPHCQYYPSSQKCHSLPDSSLCELDGINSNVKVFITHFYNQDGKKAAPEIRRFDKSACSLLICLSKNKFHVQMDASNCSRVPPGATSWSSWINHTYACADFVLVCISSPYLKVVNEADRQDSTEHVEIKNNSQSTRHIYNLMAYRHGNARNTRFIPVLLDCNINTKMLPGFLQRVPSYRWTQDYENLLCYLSR